MNKPSVPKGTRDFGPIEMARRNYIFSTIRAVFELYGFQPIETPAMENLTTLLGKYGEEGDKLIFKILNSGNFLENIDKNLFVSENASYLSNKICEKGLRYDLTVPFARFVVQHADEITFPFRRYQIQPVWRADRPQKGRYREFYQCDADIVGSQSLLHEFELLQIIDEVFKRLNIQVIIKINNRKILAGIAEIIGQPDKLIDITVAIDKLDKIGIENVKKELVGRNIPAEAIEKLDPIFNLKGNNQQKLEILTDVLASSEIGLNGITEIKELFDYSSIHNFSNEIHLDLTLARGLNYYTGCIFEVKAKNVDIGSISGGGRYDNLTGVFGLPGISGVGISFGADRIYDVLLQLNAFPDKTNFQTQVLFINFGQTELKQCILLAYQLRSEGISVEIYPENIKPKKQFAYANAKKIPFVAIIGENELANNTVAVKNMETGEQQMFKQSEMVDQLVNLIQADRKKV